jgi:hypothetical protein
MGDDGGMLGMSMGDWMLLVLRGVFGTVGLDAILVLGEMLEGIDGVVFGRTSIVLVGLVERSVEGEMVAGEEENDDLVGMVEVSSALVERVLYVKDIVADTNLQWMDVGLAEQRRVYMALLDGRDPSASFDAVVGSKSEDPD